MVLTSICRIRVAVLILTAVLTALPAFAQGWTLSGTVFGGGSPLAGTSVEALQDGTTNVVASMLTTSSGTYALTLLDGTYDLRVTPPSGSGYGAETIQNIAVSGQNRTYDVILLASGGSLSGVVRGANGTPLPGVNVNAYSSNWQHLGGTTTDANGHYSIAAGGSVILQFYAYFQLQAAPDYFELIKYNVTVAGATTVDIDLPLASVSGTVYGHDLAPVADATVSITTSGWVDDSTYAYGRNAETTGQDGTYAMVVPLGTASFTVSPPAGGENSPLSQSNVPITGDLVRDFALAGTALLTGTVRGAGGVGVPGVNVNVYSDSWQYLGSALTDADGHYSVAAIGNVILQLYAYSASTAVPGYWELIRYGLQLNGDTQLDVDLPVVTVSGTVTDAHNVALSGASLQGHTSGWNAAGDTYSSSRSYASSNVDGSYSMPLFTGSASFTVYPPAGSSYSPFNESGLTLSGDLVRDFVLADAVAVSGTLRGAGNEPLAGVNVNVYSSNWQHLGSATSDANGFYSVNALGSVIVQFYAYGPGTFAPAYWELLRYGVDASTPVTLDVTLPLAHVEGVTTDSNGAGVPNVGVQGSGNAWIDDVTYGSCRADAGTAVDGSYSMYLFKGTAQFSITPPNGSGFLPVALSGVQLPGDITQRVILQRPDLAPPQIVAGPIVVHLSDTSVSISWTTDEASDSRVEFGLGSLSSSVSDSSMGTSHEITLLGLMPLATYQFRVGSSDSSGNGPTWSAVGTFGTQASPGDITPPLVIDGPRVVAIDQTTAIVEWTTDEPATSEVAYGTDDGLGTNAGDAARFTRGHSVRLTALSPLTTYSVQVTSADPDGNATSSSLFAFTTLAVPDTTPPVITSGPTVVAVTDSKVTIAWTTDEPATSGVSYNDGTDFGVITDNTLTTSHEITMSGLLAGTVYYVTVSSTDGNGNGPTLSAQFSVSTESQSDTTPPNILDLVVSDVTESSAVVTFGSDEAANSTISYGVSSPPTENMQAEVQLGFEHQYQLRGLTEDTRYYFVVTIHDASGNSTESAVISFVTDSSAVDLPPTPPSPVTAPALTREQAYQVGWGAATDDIALASYDVLRDGSVVATLPSTASSYSESGIGEGTYSYQIRANDSAGQSSLSAIVTVVVDRTAPEISADDVTVEATGSSTVVAYAVSASDEVGGSTAVACSPLSGSQFGVGNTIVHCTSTDAAGNEGSASFTVTVEDTTPPSLNVPSALSAEASSGDGATATFTASGVDLVDGALEAVCNPPSGSLFALGDNTVVCESVDAAGNVGSASFVVRVIDTTPPSVGVPADLTVEATSGDGAVAMFNATALDSVSGMLAASCSPPSGSTFRLGSTNVTCTAIDLAGNRGAASFVVHVRDTTAPVVSVPPDMVVEAAGSTGAIVPFTVTVSDAVSADLGATCSAPSGSLFAIGTSTVSCTATDGAGNRGNASFNVTVRDTTAPAIASVTPSRSVLWPPNHAMVTLSLAVAAADVVDAAPVCRVSSISSNEAANGLGDGDTGPDWVVGPGLQFQVRAERAGKGPGRVYTIVAECSDAAGNASSASTTVSVPRNAPGK